ncbi:MAG: hypothetical protein Q8O55_06940, partial [Dehalococcoidales bacterium]|nr:hypothetical protein [Dehalococcoidales bacterium]
MVTQIAVEISQLLKRMPYTIRVGNIPGGLSEFITIQAAINYANSQGGQWTIEVYTGTYDEGDITHAGPAEITIKGMGGSWSYGHGHVSIIPAATTTATFISSGILTLEDLEIRSPVLKACVRVTGSYTTLNRCYLSIPGGGEAIQMVGGTVYMADSFISAGYVHLTTALCQFLALRTRFNALGITTAGAFAHHIYLTDCDFRNNDIDSSSSGATPLDVRGCNIIYMIRNQGTGAFTIRDSSIHNVINTNAA